MSGDPVTERLAALVVRGEDQLRRLRALSARLDELNADAEGLSACVEGLVRHLETKGAQR